MTVQAFLSILQRSRCDLRFGVYIYMQPDCCVQESSGCLHATCCMHVCDLRIFNVTFAMSSSLPVVGVWNQEVQHFVLVQAG